METVKTSVVARRQGEKRMKKNGAENFYGNENTLYDTIMIDTCYYMFVQTHRLYNIESKP